LASDIDLLDHHEGRARTWRPLGSCHFEPICVSCSLFVTTAEFKPTPERQRDDAAARGQVSRQKIFDALLSRLDVMAS
jgi:hypothetical protein